MRSLGCEWKGHRVKTNVTDIVFPNGKPFRALDPPDERSPDQQPDTDVPVRNYETRVDGQAAH